MRGGAEDDRHDAPGPARSRPALHLGQRADTTLRDVLRLHSVRQLNVMLGDEMQTAIRINILIWVVAVINFLIGLTTGYIVGSIQ